jgi:tetratricopeptide (TPR) repeat protein
MQPEQTPIAWWRRIAAYWLYACGQTCCYWGIRTTEAWFFRSGVNLFSMAIRVWPEFSGAYYRRGLIRGRELSEHVAGIADLTRVIQLSPEWPEAYLQRGLFQRFHGDPHAAIADLEQFLRLGGELYWRMEAERQIRMLHEEIALFHTAGPQSPGS